MGLRGALIGGLVGAYLGGFGLTSFIASIIGSIVGSRIEDRMWRRPAPRRPATERPLADAYRQLGVAPSASDAAVKKAYHQMARKYHPDTLRAQGLSEDMMRKATDRMARINAAWELIRQKRRM